MDDFRLLWPPDVGSPGARRWVLSNLSRGRLDKGRVVVDADIAVEPELAFGTARVEGKLSFSGVTARYWGPLPPFEDIDGSAVFDADSFALALSGGKYRDIGIADGKVEFIGLGREKPPSRLAADVRFEGPLSQVLEVLDRQPLGYADYLGLDPKTVSGDAAFNLRVGLPLLDALALDDVSLEAEGEVVNAHLPVAPLKTDLERARIDVKVDKERVAVSGGGSLDRAGRRHSTLSSASRTAIRVETLFTLRTTVDEGGRKRLGFDLAPYVSGSRRDRRRWHGLSGQHRRICRQGRS